MKRVMRQWVALGMVAFLVATAAPAGAAPGQTEWTRQFGTSGGDFVAGVAANATGVYVAGMTDGSLRGTSRGHSDIFVRKYDVNGRHQWTRQFGTSEEDWASGVAVDATGVYVVGEVWEEALKGTNKGGWDVFVRKYDTNGHHLWTRQFGTTAEDMGHGATVDGTGVYVTGYTYGSLRGANRGGSDAFVRKYDTNGHHQWTRQFGTAANDAAHSVAVNGTGVYLSGETTGSLKGANRGASDVFVRKYDTSGRHQWTRQFGTIGGDWGFSVSVTGSALYVAGYTDGSLQGSNKGLVDAFIRKYDTSGRHQWTRQYGTGYNDYAFSVASDGTGPFLTGYTGGSLQGTNKGWNDAYVRKYDTTGRHSWTRQFGTAEIDAGNVVATDASGVYIGGDTYGSLRGTNQGSFDAFVRKYQK